MKVSVIIPHFWKERLPNLALLTHALNAGTVKPDEIIIWNNDDLMIEPHPASNIHVVNAPRNVGCQARFIASFMARGEYVLFQDNDTCAQPGTIENMLRWSERLPNSVVSFDGYVLPNGQPYHTLKQTFGLSRTEPIEINIALGHMEMVKRSLLHILLANFPFDETTVMDDLWFNQCCEILSVKRYVVPCGPTDGMAGLPMRGVGMCLNTDLHYPERQRIHSMLFPAEVAV